MNLHRLVSIFGFLILVISCHEQPTLQDLEEKILDKLLDEEGTFAVAFHDLQSDQYLRINSQEDFHAASTMKTPVMIEVFRQEAAGSFSQEDSIEIRNEFFSIIDSSLFSLDIAEDSGDGLYEYLGLKKTISDLVYDMIIVSSNLATNLVVDLVGAKNVTQTMRKLGAQKIQVLRGVEDIKAYEAGISNRTNAEDLMIIFTTMAKEEIVSESASEMMINILKDQKLYEIIPAHLPSDVQVAHKTGAITGVHHDSGIIFLPDGRKYVLVLLSKELPDFDHGTKVLAEVSKMIYDFVVNEL